MLSTSSNGQIQFSNLVCPECGDNVLHPMANFCPRCFVPIFPDPKASEEIKEITQPGAVDCFILANNSSVVPILSQPDLKSRRLFVMTGNDVVAILKEEQAFYQVTTQGGTDGYVLKEWGIKVKVGLDEVRPNQALGYFRVNEHLLGWKAPKLSYQITSAPIRLEPYLASRELAQIQSDLVLPVVGETYGWFEIQLPSFFRGWIPEAYGYRMLRHNSLPGLSRPLSTGEIIAGIAGVAAVVTLVGVGGAVAAIGSSMSSK